MCGNVSFSDNEIIKALECCIKSAHFGECFENKCPMVSKEGCKVGKETLYPYALDLINRQKCEIEQYKDYNAKWMEKHEEARSEAIKEFWSKLKTHSRKMQSSDFSGEFWDKAVLVEDGDNLVKEMEGEE